MLIEGTVAFSNIDELEVYQGKSTGRYSLVITLDDAAASELTDMGVNVKDYEGQGQRKFASKFKVPAVDANDNPVTGEIPYGSKVRLLYKTGPAHPEHGVPTYLNRIRVLEMGEMSGAADPGDDEF